MLDAFTAENPLKKKKLIVAIEPFVMMHELRAATELIHSIVR